MDQIQGLLLGVFAVILSVFLPNLIYLGLGCILVRFQRTCHIGVRFLAMSMLAAKMTARYCTCDCENTDCRNWTCAKYSEKYHK